MAGENDVVIDAKVKTEDAKSGVQDLFDQIEDMKGKLEDLGDSAGVDTLEEKFNRLSGTFENLGLSVGTWDQMLQKASQVAAAELDDIFNAVDKTIDAHDKATEAVRRYFDEIEKGGKKGSKKDRLGGGGEEDAFKELGEEQLGFSARGTVSGRLERLGRGISDFFSGDDYTADADREGRKAGDRQRQIDKNNEKEQERREFEASAADHNNRERQREREKYFQEESRIDEKEAKDREAAAVKAGRQQLELNDRLGKAEQHKADAQERFDRQESLRAISREKYAQEKHFGGGTVGFESIYSQFAGAANAGKDDPAEKARQQREEIAKRQDELRRQWHEEDLAKQDKVIEEMKRGLGLA